MSWELDYLRVQRSEEGRALSYKAAVRGPEEESLPVFLAADHPAVKKLELLLDACQQGEATREDVAAYLAAYTAHGTREAAAPSHAEPKPLEARPVAVVLKSGEAFEALLLEQDGLLLKLLHGKKPRELSLREIASLDYL